MIEKVKELREKTGVGILDCKIALQESKGDIDKAIEILRKKGIAASERKAGRITEEGIIESYIHPGEKLGAMVEVNCETDFVARNKNFRKFAKDITMHIAACNPLYIKRSDVPQEVIEKEREIYLAQLKDKNKPQKILDKIVEGKLEKFFSEFCLTEQPFVKDPEKTVEDVLKDNIFKLGENIVIKRFVRFRLGEV